MGNCPSSIHQLNRPTHSLLLLMGVALAFRGPAVVGQELPLTGPSFPRVETPMEQAGPALYWIASSRECCQRGQTRCPQGTLRYFAADAENHLTDLAEPAFLGSLNYDVPVCFVIHGDLTSFEDVRQAAPRIVKWIHEGAGGQPVQIVFYTWPSDDEFAPLPELDISARGERAEFNACYLAKLISQFPAQTRVSFFGHSFGARMTAATLHLIAGGTLPSCQFRCNPGAPRAYRAVFIAAALDRNWLNPAERYGRSLLATQWLLNIHNGADMVINLYPIRTLFGRQALGRLGFSPSDRFRMGQLASRVSDWDVTMSIGTGHAWSYYYKRPEIAAVMAPLLVYSDGTAGAVTPDTAATQPARVIQKPSTPLLRDSSRTQETSPTRSGL